MIVEGCGALCFASEASLAPLFERWRQQDAVMDEFILDEGYGRSVCVYDPDGLTIQINEHDPRLYASGAR